LCSISINSNFLSWNLKINYLLNAIFIKITNHEIDLDLTPYDAIVVGSGATGGIAALTLAEQGIKVLVLEAGPQVKRDEASNYEPKSTF